MTMMTLHEAALDEADRVVSGLDDADLSRPSECDGWTIGTLLEHMTGQNLGFAQAIRTGDADEAAYAPADAAGWSASLEALRTAVGKPAETIRLVELAPTRPFDLDTVLQIHTLDTVAHTWDVAGRGYRPPDELVDAAAATSAMVPTDGRPESGGAFRAALKPEATDDLWERTLRHLGRRP